MYHFEYTDPSTPFPDTQVSTFSDLLEPLDESGQDFFRRCVGDTCVQLIGSFGYQVYSLQGSLDLEREHANFLVPVGERVISFDYNKACEVGHAINIDFINLVICIIPHRRPYGLISFSYQDDWLGIRRNNDSDEANNSVRIGPELQPGSLSFLRSLQKIVNSIENGYWIIEAHEPKRYRLYQKSVNNRHVRLIRVGI